jgi:hypothetical protein
MASRGGASVDGSLPPGGGFPLPLEEELLPVEATE